MSTNSPFVNAVVFGSLKPGIEYFERRAAYVVIIDDGKVAMVGNGRDHFLPGGGSWPGEAPEMTIARQVREELGLTVRRLRAVGEATQYFYSAADDCHYEMLATFFAGEFTNPALSATGEHQLEWLPSSEATTRCFHECHAWAVRESTVVARQSSDRSGGVCES